jgi:hypothetical protein
MTKTAVTDIKKIFLLMSTNVAGTEKIFSFTNTKVSLAETLVSVAQMISSDIESMVFETETLVCEMKTMSRVFVQRGSGLAPPDILKTPLDDMLLLKVSEKSFDFWNNPEDAGAIGSGSQQMQR